MLSVGIIGFGRIGAEHAGWLSKASGVRALAVADGTAARQELAGGRGLKTYGEIHALLEDPRIDAVLVSTPTAMHFEHGMQALQSGKHLMLEKPMAMDLRQATGLVEEAERRKRVLSVFHNRRWDPDYLRVRQMVASGVLGKLINIESRLGQFASCVGPAALEYRPGWRNEGAFGGGGLYDWGSHFIDQIWRLLWPARPVNVFAQLRGNVWSQDCDDFARVCIDFDNGAAALVEINTTTKHPLPRWHLDGVEGSAFSPASPTFDTAVWADLQLVPAREDAGRPPTTIPAEPSLSETRIWEQFAAAVAAPSGAARPAVTARSVLPTMALLDAARASGRSGASVAPNTIEWVYE